MVRWLLDECVEAGLVAIFRAGHDVVYMTDVEPRAPDTEVMDRATREQRLLLTEDKDFGDLVFRDGRPVPGIVLMRIDTAHWLQKGPRLLAAVELLGESLLGHYTVIESARFRLRPLRPL